VTPSVVYPGNTNPGDATAGISVCFTRLYGKIGVYGLYDVIKVDRVCRLATTIISDLQEKP